MKTIIGKKVGMTQIFLEGGRLVPVTAIDIGNWYVVGHKLEDRDGYKAAQVGLARKRYQEASFSADWLKKPQKFFSAIREVSFEGEAAPEVGSRIDFASFIKEGDKIDAFGITKGKGFQGVVKRHNFSGGPASHGPRLGRIPGSIGGHRSQGKVDKGRKLPGHMGVDCRSILNLEIVKIEADHSVVFIKGSVPGHAGALVSLRKSARII